MKKTAHRLCRQFPALLFCLFFLLSTDFATGGTFSGDVSHDGQITLKDSVLSLQIISGVSSAAPGYSDADINNDSAVGLAEAIYSLSVAAELLPPVTWDETAVRKILQTFAYGGHPTDAQIEQWAAMNPREAIDEMLTLDPFNTKLSPADYDQLNVLTDGSLEGLSDLFSSDSPNNFILPNKRSSYYKKGWGAPRYNWIMAIRSKGLNTFLHRIGFWETNYHMSVNQEAGVYPHPILRHYDNIIQAHGNQLPYQQVMAKGALNAAIAYQYGHNHNVFIDGVFRGNDDFAREFHQLFFGILGVNEPSYHESVSIENTAKALTGIVAFWLPSEEGGPTVEAFFYADNHHVDPLEILHTTITGPTAKEKIENLADVAIENQESLDNLPIKIVSTLADDNITDVKKTAIQRLWQSLPEKNLLEFLKKYALSPLFHSSDRFKYNTTFDRYLFIHNQMLLTNKELYEELNNVRYLFSEDSVTPFEPLHNVFGHQAGIEAYNSPTIFRNAYNASTDWYWYYTNVDSSHSDYVKDWQTVIPANQYNTYMVKDVAEWLWKRFVADGLKNYGVLERAHLHTLLATGHDLGYYMYDNLPNSPPPTTTYYSTDFADVGSPASIMIQNAGNAYIQLDSSDSGTRETANRRIQMAIAFIAATPYSFVQEGR